jgi:anaerobic magnesium-protoporphyrin IX monomethyl ester cyclase
VKSILLIYPFFKPAYDRSLFRFPPLGIAYVAAALRAAGHQVSLLDCTFLSRDDALRRAVVLRADVVGVYSMITMRRDAIRFSRALRPTGAFLVAGGPLPTSDPGLFLRDFDLVVAGEGERTMCELVAALESGTDARSIPGTVFPDSGGDARAGARALEPDLDALPFPARDLFDNDRYIRHSRSRYGYAITTVMTTRGCPFSCEFCSNVMFGTTCRVRSVENVVDEVEHALSFGYDRIHFADDVFTLDRVRVDRICGEIERRRLRLSWECLGRVDSIDTTLARRMKAAGCDRIFFGIESGNNDVLALMNKKITIEKADRAVRAAHAAGLHTGAFFILYYPGETDATVLDTLRFALSLPLDYVSFTMPYPIPGTGLYRRVVGREVREWKQPDALLFDHALTFDADVSQGKMRFAILKGQVHFEIKRRLGRAGVPVARLFERPTDLLLRIMR